MPPTTLWTRLTAWLATGQPHGAAAVAAASHERNGTSYAAQKQLRAQRREQLFGLVRENMIRAGVLSSAYKFKVLTLDSLGQSFIVLIDVQGHAIRHDAATLAGLEAQLQTLCRDRLSLTVKNVYWRLAEDVNAKPATKTDAAALLPAERRHQAESLLTPARAPSPPTPPTAPPDHERDFAPTQPLPPYPDDPDPLSDTQYGRLE